MFYTNYYWEWDTTKLEEKTIKKRQPVIPIKKQRQLFKKLAKNVAIPSQPFYRATLS
jgi:hypothetical protein